MPFKLGNGAVASLARILFVIVATCLLSSFIDPYLPSDRPLIVHATNALLPLIFALFLLSLTGRALVSLFLTAVGLGALRYATLEKTAVLQTQLVYADLRFLAGLLEEPELVLGFVKVTAFTVATALGILAACIFVWWFARRERSLSWIPRGACFTIATAALFGIGTVKATPSVIRALDWHPYQQTGGGLRVGVAGNILMGRMTAQDIKRLSNSKLIESFWNEPLVQEMAKTLPKQGNSLRPDIILIQSESLFEASQLCSMSDTPVLQNIAAQKPTGPRQSGNLVVPVFGGQTVQSEFEALSGTPISFYNGSSYAYFDVLDQPVNAFPRFLGDLKYKTIAIHPFQRNFWNRGWALPMLGFQTFIDGDAFFSDDRIPGRRFVSDMALTRSVLAELDASDRPTFVTAITINNHGPFGVYAPADDSNLGLPETLSGDARRELADYVNRSQEADQAYGYLLEALKRRGRPTIVVIYGDHLPPMPSTYKKLCFKDGKVAWKQRTPFKVWANFSVPEAPETTSAFLMQGWIAKAAGLPLEGQLLANAIAGEIVHNPAIPEADRKRILAGYANIAAAHLETRPARNPDEPITYVIKPDKTLGALRELKAQGPEIDDASVKSANLPLQVQPGGRSEMTFNTQGSIAWMTLRPYVASSSTCSESDGSMPMRFTVQGDGRTLYSAVLKQRALRLVTLDLRGIKTVTFQTEAGPGAKSCDAAYVRVAQMQCLSADCKGSFTVAAPHRNLVSRSLGADPLEDDLAALSSTTFVAAEPSSKASSPH